MPGGVLAVTIAETRFDKEKPTRLLTASGLLRKRPGSSSLEVFSASAPVGGIPLDMQEMIVNMFAPLRANEDYTPDAIGQCVYDVLTTYMRDLKEIVGGTPVAFACGLYCHFTT